MKCCHAVLRDESDPLWRISSLQTWFKGDCDVGFPPASFVNVSFSILHHERRTSTSSHSSTAGQSCPLWQTKITSENKILFMMGLRNAARCLFDPYAGGPPGKDARRKAENPRCKRQASSAPNVRADCADSCNSDAFPTDFGTRASVPLFAAGSPTSAFSADPGVGGSPAYDDGAQRVKREPKRHTMRRCYHQSGDARRCGDGVLEVVEVCASWGRATVRVRVLWGARRSDTAVVVSFDLFFSRWEGRRREILEGWNVGQGHVQSKPTETFFSKAWCRRRYAQTRRLRVTVLYSPAVFFFAFSHQRSPSRPITRAHHVRPITMGSRVA